MIDKYITDRIMFLKGFMDKDQTADFIYKLNIQLAELYAMQQYLSGVNCSTCKYFDVNDCVMWETLSNYNICLVDYKCSRFVRKEGENDERGYRK